MVWVRLDDQFDQHPKVTRVGALGMALQVAALCWTARGLTDGQLPYRAARRLVDTAEYGIDIEQVIGELVQAGMWHEPGHTCDRCPQPALDGLVIHDWSVFQPSRQQVETDRAAARERMTRRRHHKARSPDVRANTTPNNPPNSTPNGEAKHPPNLARSSGQVHPPPGPVSRTRKTRTSSSSPNPSFADRAVTRTTDDDDDDRAHALKPKGGVRATLNAGVDPPDGVKWTATSWTSSPLERATPDEAIEVLLEHVAEHHHGPPLPTGTPRTVRQLVERYERPAVLSALDRAVTHGADDPVAYARQILQTEASFT